MDADIGWFDFVIVGAGSAGCVLAERLSACGCRKVLLLEAGGPGGNPLHRLPMLAARLFQSRRNNWYFHTEPQINLAGRRIFLPRGRMVGGSFVFNGAQYVRGHRYDFDHWHALGNRGWSFAEVLPYFKRLERHQRGHDLFHGGDGPLRVEKLTEINPLSEAFLSASIQAGHGSNENFNAASQDGFGVYDFNIEAGRRQTTAHTYLRPALGRPNLHVETRAAAHRILIEDGRASGVEYHARGRIWRARAGREVILCGGSINSPKLLMLSGIGDAGALRRLGIQVQQDLPGVGANLQDHLTVSIGYRCTRAVSLVGTLRADRLALALVEAVVAGRGPLSRSPLEAGGFLRTRAGLPAPDCQVVFVPIHARGGRQVWFPGESVGDSFALRVWPSRPESRGFVALRSPDPDESPIIDPRFLSAESDLVVTRAGLRALRRIVAQPAFDPYRGEEFDPGVDWTTDHGIDEHIRATATTGHHTCGTARMGHDPLAVVDDRLRVHGIRGLRVADASVMPTMVSANTNAATIMIGEKAADLLLERPPLATVPLPETAPPPEPRTMRAAVAVGRTPAPRLTMAGGAATSAPARGPA